MAQLQNKIKIVKYTHQAHNVYTALVLGHIYVTSYMDVYATLLQHL